MVVLMATDWIMTYTGRRFFPLAPRAEDVCIEDIAHALALTNRFNGHTRVPYSVAQHSVLVSCALGNEHGPAAGLVGLLHDASEAYLCDIPRPVKRLIGDYAFHEMQVQACVYRAFGVALTDGLEASLKLADRRMLRTEQAWLMPPPAEGEDRGDVEPYVFLLRPSAWDVAEHAFLARFNELKGRSEDAFPAHETIADM